MTKSFNGVINIDIRDSVPDWEPYEQPKAPEGAPNVLFITWDDVGIAAMEPFGGKIKTPAMKRIADMGLRYSQFHTTALCSPTRAALLTGRNHTTVGMSCIAEATTGFPGSNGHIPFETALISEVLVENGYNTYMVGKWHLCPEDETNMASTKRNWPTGRGFERYYGFLGGETNQWYPSLVEDQKFIDQPYSPEEGYHLSKDLAERAIEMIGNAKQIAPNKPFFMYYAPGAGHAPHHIFKEWADKYNGMFDEGYEKYAGEVTERMKELGIIPKNTDLAPMNSMIDETSPDGIPWPEVDTIRPWDSLNKDEKRLFARMAEVYAGFVEYTDHQINRLLESEFPYPQSELALERLKLWFERRLADLDSFAHESDETTVKETCIVALTELFDYLPILGFLLRSTNVRNAFETFYPLLRLAREILEPTVPER
jgi:arylsulfatase